VKKGLVILVIVIATITFGILELYKVDKVLSTMEIAIMGLYKEYEENEEDIKKFSSKVGNIKEYWLEQEDWLGFIFNNRDLSTITDSINRLQAYTKNNDYDNAIAELSMLEQYSTENSHIMGFNFKNIF
jgi:hypothetical protein